MMKLFKYTRILVVFLPSILLLNGCASYQQQKSHKLIQQGNTKEGLEILENINAKNPDKYRYSLFLEKENVIKKKLQDANNARNRGAYDESYNLYQEVLLYDASSTEAFRGLDLLQKEKDQNLVVEDFNKNVEDGYLDKANDQLNGLDNRHIKNSNFLKNKIKVENSYVNDDEIHQKFKKPVSLMLSDVDVKTVFELIAQTSGLNFIFDQDLKVDMRTTLFAKDTSIESALGLILSTNQLKMKILNDNTLLIYANTEEKKKQYEELLIQTFYLENIEPKKMLEMIKSLIAPKSLYIDEKLKLLVVRDTPEVLKVIKKLVETYDVVEPEVVLEVEILEINNDDMLNVGVQFPDQVKMGLTGSVAGMTFNQLKHLNGNDYPLFFPNPLAILNLKQTSGKTKTLANPRIRVINQQKAKILIGNKVPVITTTTNQNSSASTESVNYLDVGLSLAVEPNIHINDEVTINIDMEVSNIAKEIKSSTGLLAYQIGTRNANTILRLKNGETQVLAGLIQNDQTKSASHIPGLGKIPILGKVFSNETNTKNKTEVVLLITPYIVKNINNTASRIFHSGTENNITSRPARLTKDATYQIDQSSTFSQEAQEQIPVAPVSQNGDAIDPSMLPNTSSQ